MSKLLKIILDEKEERLIKLDQPELMYGIQGIFFEEDFKTAYIPSIEKEVPVILANKNKFFIPAHIQEDWDYAKKKNLEINQVVAPYFLGTGEEKPKSYIDTEVRHSVIAMIENPNTGKYLCVDCKNRNCKSFILGGIERDETPEDAAIREVREETGYTDVEITYKSPITIINHFYADYRNINRYARLDIIIGKLVSDKNIGLSAEEYAKHTVKWVKKDELKEFLTVNNNLYALDILLNGDRPYTDEGILINSRRLNGMTKSEAREILESEE